MALLAAEALGPGNFGISGTPDMPVASTRCFGRRVTRSPARSTTTIHSLRASSKRALLHSDDVQQFSSITLAYISSQSPSLSLGEKTGQWSGNGRYGMWSYQTGSCRQSDL